MEINKKYETGVLWQDLQHKELIDLLKKANPGSENFNASTYTYTLAFLVMYVNQHFSLEEGYMDHYGYPDSNTHKKIHKEFVQKLKKYKAEYKTYSRKSADKLIENIEDWVLNHILKNDQKLGTFILEKEKTI